MEEIEPWKAWTMKKLLSNQGDISAVMGSSKNKFHSKNRFDELVLGTESEMRVSESILDQLSSFSGRFTINDIDLKEADFFAPDSPSKDGKCTQNFFNEGFPHQDFPMGIQPVDSSQNQAEYSQNQAESSHKPLPPFHHFRLPPPPPPPHISLRDEGSVRQLDDLVSAQPSDVVNVNSNVPLSTDLITTETTPSEAKTQFQLPNCFSAPSTIPPFKSKGKSSKLFANDRRRATADNPAAPGELPCIC